jgi:hypothetical protein
MQAWRADPALLFHLLPLELWQMLELIYRRGVSEPPSIRMNERGDIVVPDELSGPPGKRRRLCDRYLFGQRKFAAALGAFVPLEYTSTTGVALRWKYFVCSVCMQYRDDKDRAFGGCLARSDETGVHCKQCCTAHYCIARVRTPRMLAALSGAADPRCLATARALFLPDRMCDVVARVSLYPSVEQSGGGIIVAWHDGLTGECKAAGVLLADGQTLRVTVPDGSRAFHPPFDTNALYRMCVLGMM